MSNFLRLWFVTPIINLRNVQVFFTFSVKVAISEVLKLFFWNPPLTPF